MFSFLQVERLNGLDITPTLAENLCTKLLGRGVDVRIALEKFATEGRTAANKSKVGPEILDQLEATLEPMVQALVMAMTEIRVRYRDDFDDCVAHRRFKP